MRVGRSAVPGTPSAASAVRTSYVRPAQASTRGSASMRVGYQTAAATADVVALGGSAARSATRAPASRSRTAQVSPMIPAPTTRTSTTDAG
jgi:hypothetical protein